MNSDNSVIEPFKDFPFYKFKLDEMIDMKFIGHNDGIMTRYILNNKTNQYEILDKVEGAIKEIETKK